MAYQYQAYVPSSQVNNYRRRQDTATNTYNAYAQAGYSQGAGGLGAQISSSQARLDALYRNNNLSQQFSYGNQAQYNQALNNITNRKAFEYDLSNDMLFQQAKEQYQAMGKTAMADTIGQASAMTGGYGNSYAATAGNQAYQAHLRELNNSISDYYAMALSTYNNETNRLNGVFNALSTDRSNEFNEWQGNWNVYNNLYNMYSGEVRDWTNMDMNAWQQKGTNLYNAANLATSQYGTASNNDINIWNNQQNLRATQAQQEETERSNRANEQHNANVLAETTRHNQATETETRRANQASETQNANALAETRRHNQATEAETTRSNQATEDINRTRAASSTTNSSKSNAVNKSGKQYSDHDMIDIIDRQIQNVLYNKFNGDYQAAKQYVVNSVLNAYFNNGVTPKVADKVRDYYNMK